MPSKKLGPLPSQLFAALERTMLSSHHDENPGVPIGARSMALTVLAFFDDEDENAKYLNLGNIWDDPSKWAMKYCLNPIRSSKKGRYQCPAIRG